MRGDGMIVSRRYRNARRLSRGRVVSRWDRRSSPSSLNCGTTPQGGLRRADDSQPRGGPESPAAAPEVMIRGDGIGEVSGDATIVSW